MSAHPRSLTQLIFFQELGSLLEFPLWWYSRGVMTVIRWSEEGLAYSWKEKAFGLWIKNLFTPMYGDRSWSGRALSTVMRIAVVFGRGIAFLVQVWAYLCMLLVWLLLPLLGLLMLIRPLGSIVWSALIAP